MSLERVDQLRRRLLLTGAIVSVPLALIRYWGVPDGYWRMLAAVLFLAGLAWLTLWSKAKERWKVLLPAVVAVAAGPVTCAFHPIDLIELVALSFVPVIMAVFFLDRFEAVVASCVLGFLTTAALMLRLDWPLTDIVSTLGAYVGLLAAVALASAGVDKLREVERITTAEHGQALRLSETRRSQAERLAIVGRLASGVAHEINNPLAFVKSNVSALKRSASHEDELSPEELDELISDTTQGIDRICQIVADLKGFAREDSGLVEPVDLHESVSGAVRLAMVRLPKHTKVSVELPPDAPLVRANPRKLAQVLLNLLVNAGDALEELRVPSPLVAIKARVEGEALALSITDNGPGISPEAMARLFEPFFTTKAPGKGTGLGLALSREYVEGFGGTLSVQNVTPSGAQFTISLRLASPSSSLTPVPATDDGSRTFNRRKAS